MNTLGRSKLTSTSITGLFVIACCCLLFFARDLIMPIVAGIILSLVLSPVIRKLKKYGLPEPLAAAFLVIGLVVATGTAAYNLSEPVAEWVEAAPEVFPRIERKLETLKKPVEEIKKASENVEEITDVEPGENSAQEVVIQTPKLHERLLGGLRDILAQFVIIFGLLFFLLASGDMFLEKTVSSLPRLADKKRAVDIVRETQRLVSRYLLTISLINVSLGTVTAVFMVFLGVPNVVLWGIVAALLNFIPYLGALLGIGTFFVVGLLSFDELWKALLVSGGYFLLTVIEGQFVTPAVLGMRLKMNPVVIFVAVVFWGWMWGIPGLLLAVPLLLTFKIVCDRFESLSAIGDYLGSRAS